MRFSPIFIILFSLIIVGCEYFQQKEELERVPIARARNSILYKDDLSGLVPRNVSKDDSIKLTEKYVNDWIKKQLILSKAQEEISLNVAEIDRKVVDYRYALIVHEFEKLYVNSHLNVAVSPEEIETYYDEQQDNFVLKQNIIKCLFVQVPKNVPEIRQLRRNIRSFPNTNKEDIAQFSLQYAIKTFLDDSVWIDFDDVIFETPLENITNKIQFLRNTTYSETSDKDFIYFLRILDYKISDQISPLDYVREDIESIIISKRKLALKQELENTIYDEALSENTFEIYRN